MPAICLDDFYNGQTSSAIALHGFAGARKTSRLGSRQLCGFEAWGADLTSGLRTKVRPGLSSHAIVPNQIRRIIAESRECRAGVSYSSSYRKICSQLGSIGLDRDGPHDCEPSSGSSAIYERQDKGMLRTGRT